MSVADALRIAARLSVWARMAVSLSLDHRKAFAMTYRQLTARPRLFPAPIFDACFRERFDELVRWRRDVRHFRRDSLPAGELEKLIALAARAPSVGFSQPCRWVRVGSPERRAKVAANFARCNAAALGCYGGERARLYANIKLAGLDQAPEHLAVFCDGAVPAGHGLGRATMPETLAYSVVMAIHTLWLAARAEGIGLGWVSILEPKEVARALDAPGGWRFVAYLCLGYPVEESPTPELARRGWESPDDRAAALLER
jgi:5,6-dimethylbenzimidazole synthase